MQWKTVVFLVSIAVATTSIRAEYETLNLFGSIGGGFGMGGTLYESSKVEDGNTTVTDRFFNYGSGFKFDVGCQYFLMENVALQPSFSYSVGIPFKVENITALQTTTTTFSRHLFGIKVQVVPHFEVLDLITMYTGVGIGFFWNSRPFKTVSETGTGGTTLTQETTGKIASKPALGFLAALGTDYPLNDKLTLFGELGVEQISFSLDKYVVKKPDSQTIYYSKDDSNTDNLNPQKVPGSNFQIRFGVRYAIK
ncbi:MAG: outer membrane beta-barrel protein [Chitinispirillaceae bacterium]|nr:outer membrane beta-barrel protein [Chitinispirillaceae bacterium]